MQDSEGYRCRLVIVKGAGQVSEGYRYRLVKAIDAGQ